MDNHKKRCKEILEELIKKSFREDVKGIMFMYSIKKGFSAKVSQPLFGYVAVGINKSTIGLSKKILIGILAHELSHARINKRFFRKFTILPLFSFKKYNEILEKNTDIYATDKGYGDSLLAYKLWREKNKNKFYHKKKDFYLTSKEVKDYIKIKKLPKLKFSRGNLTKL